MKYLVIAFVLFLSACSAVEIKPDVTIIPLPNSIEIRNGSFTVDSDISVSLNRQNAEKVLDQVNLEATDKFVFTKTSGKKADLSLILKEDNSKSESYRLEITKQGIQIESNSEKGLYYGMQSLKQLLLFSNSDDNRIELPLCSINDEPRFGWRGLMLDESRHFFGVEKVKQLLDLMAFHKLNIFHWHLTDAPGWRIEIKQYPKLTTVGGIGNDIDPNAEAQYYTQEEIKEIVRYAADRYIEIVPEIDMPGHAAAANRAYPEFSGGGSESHPEFTFNPGYEGTYTYLTNILHEITDLFPSEYIHMGGDEVHFGNQAWNTNKHVRELMKREKLSDLKEVESYFVHRMADSIKALNKKVIGWDEIVDHNLSNNNSVVMWWRHNMPQKLEAALRNNYSTVLCPRIPLYFDFVQDDSHKWGRKWGGAYSTLELTYAFPPDTLPGFTSNLSKVMGLQANIWTERIQNNERLDFMTNPRLSAMSEAAWTHTNNKNLDGFKKRLKPMLDFLSHNEIYYYNPFTPSLTPEPEGVDKKQKL